MDILNVFVFGTILHILLQWYRDKHKVLQMAGKNFGRMLRTERRVTQEDPVSLKIFNIVVDAVVRAVMLEVCGPQEANNGFGWAAGEHNFVLFADYGQIAGRNPIWVQTTLTAMLRRFERVGLQTNLGKTKATVCTLGFILVQQVAKTYKRRATGERATLRKWKRTRVSCVECGGK